VRTLTEPGAPAGAGTAADTVPGILCAAGHFNHPRWRHCRTCGSALLSRGARSARGPRPVIGMLIRDDGLRVAVSGPLLIVLRDAEHAPTCVAWRDRGRSLLRVRLHFADWQPVLLAEAAGARLQRRGSPALPLDPATPTPLLGGWSIHLGRGAFLYESLVPDDLTPGPQAEPVAAPTTKGRHRARRSRLPDPAIFPRRSTP
jgi:hypothetical protein